MEHPDKYKGYQFIIDGNDIHDARKKLTMLISYLLYSLKRYEINVGIINIEVVSPKIQRQCEECDIDCGKKRKVKNEEKRAS